MLTIAPAASVLGFTQVLPVKPEPPNVVEDANWLIATAGFCSSLNVDVKDRYVEASEVNTNGRFIADISFNYYPQSMVKFTDFPHHRANAIKADADEADALVSSSWDHKNIALLEPTTTCSADDGGSEAWGISVFKVEEHRPCTDAETVWEGHPCVRYSGYVSAATDNFVNVNSGRFVCQLFVDSSKNNCESMCMGKNGKQTCGLLENKAGITSGCVNGEYICFQNFPSGDAKAYYYRKYITADTSRGTNLCDTWCKGIADNQLDTTDSAVQAFLQDFEKYGRKASDYGPGATFTPAGLYQGGDGRMCQVVAGMVGLGHEYGNMVSAWYGNSAPGYGSGINSAFAHFAKNVGLQPPSYGQKLSVDHSLCDLRSAHLECY